METLMYTSTHSHPSKHIHGQHTHSCAHTHTNPNTYMDNTHTHVHTHLHQSKHIHGQHAHLICFLLLNFPTFKKWKWYSCEAPVRKGKGCIYLQTTSHLYVCLSVLGIQQMCYVSSTRLLLWTPELHPNHRTRKALSPVRVILGPLSLRGVFGSISLSEEAFTHPVMAPSSNVLCKQISQFGRYRLRDRCGTSSFANYTEMCN